MRRFLPFTACLALAGCSSDFSPRVLIEGVAWASGRRRRHTGGTGSGLGSSDASIIPVYVQSSGALHTLIYPGLEQSSGSVLPWGNYVGIAPAIARNSSTGNLIAVIRRATTHGIDVANAKIVMNTSTTGGAGWRYQRDNEPEIEDIVTEDPYHEALMNRATDNLLMLSYERDHSGTPSRSAHYRTSSDFGATWSAVVNHNQLGTQFTSSVGHCIELPWGTGACPGTGCAILCPLLANTIGETRRRAYGVRSNGGLAAAAFFQTGTFAFDSDPSGVPYSEWQPQLLSGTGNCGAATSSSCIIGLARRNDTVCQVYQSYSRDSGNTWDTLSTAFPGGGWPTMAQDPTTGYLVATTRGCPATGVAGAGRSRMYVSANRGQSWTGPTEIADPSEPSASGFGADSSSIHQEIIPLALGTARAGVARFGVIGAQESITTHWYYQEVFVGGPPVASEIPWKSTHALDKITTPTPATYATYGQVTALHGTAHFACGLWHRNDTFTQTEDLFRYWNSANNSHDSFSLRRSNTNPHWELWLAATVTTFEALNGANNTSIIDKNEPVFWTYDGTGVGNNGRLRLTVDDHDQTGTYTGLIPAVMTSPTTAILSIAATGAGANYLRDGWLDHIACWIGTSAPTMAQHVAASSAWRHGGSPNDPTVVAAAWGGPAPELYFPLDSDFTNQGTLNIGSPTVTGAAEFTNTRVVGPGFLAP